MDQAREGLISGNLVYNASGIGNANYGSDGDSVSGIYIDGGTSIVIENNILHDNNIGLQITSEHSCGLASYVTTRGNVIYHNTLSGISLGGYSTSVGSMDHCTIANNTLFENDSLQDGMGEVNLQYFPSTVSGNVFENKILYPNAQSTLVSSWVNTPVITMDYSPNYASNGLGSYSWI